MDSTRTDSPQRTGSERNNWLLLALVALVSFGGAVLYAVVDDPDSPIYLAYFVVMAAAVAGVAFWWFGAHPPRLSEPRWGYLGVVVLLIAGGTLLRIVPGTRAIASWLTIGACFVLYGLLERSAAVAAYALDLAQLGLVLEIVTNCRAGIIEMRMTGTANTTLMSSR
ncbi:hypothetical protein [Brevibacterium sp. CS2]|uniref:hypothetical protein n=1 Tax=Brevibacterium sp. CS2 TaxID=2575923 RepID=UPI0010C7C739|nr:hypothetical protein [Brevibacterium sp. CS2]QCP06323.1 hypothetical protein FDF13_14400 [Brevibacterium sp. CS2]